MIQVRGVEQDPFESRTASAHNIDLIEVTDVDGGLFPRPASGEGDLEEARIRLLDFLHVRIEHRVEVRCETQAIEMSVERAVRVRDHHTPQPTGAETLKEWNQIVGYALPEVVQGVIRTEFSQRLSNPVVNRDAGTPQDGGEVDQTSGVVIRTSDERRIFEVAFRKRFSRAKNLAACGHTAVGKS